MTAVTKVCDHCGKPFETVSATARFDSAKCRKAAFNKRHEGVRTLEGRSGEAQTSVVEAVRADLEAAGRLETYLGASALRLAERIDSSTAVMGFAALVKQLESTMGAATKGAQTQRTALDELRARRDAKRSA